ncbi:hypothetical protein J3R82DRAFT_2094 [Butyriboletus roseoflavus]|nr:hypothetical protein J3R82DRAFT_2094 [Butyriboletus roseoflavus]
MTLLSLFMTSTGIFCFVPISQRLVESGIIPESNSWRFRKVPPVLAPTFYARIEDRLQFLLPADEVGNGWSEPELPLCSADGTFTTEQQLATPRANDISSPLESWPTNSLSHSTSIDTSYGREFTSFISVTQDSTLCDSCNTLLRREIPPDHIPSVIRAMALFEAQDRFPDVVFNECEVIALTDAFSMLRL